MLCWYLLSLSASQSPTDLGEIAVLRLLKKKVLSVVPVLTFGHIQGMQEGIKMFWICLKRTSAGKTSSPQTFQAVQSTSQSLNLSLKLKHATGEVITYLSAEWSLMWLCTEDRSGDLDTHRLVRFILALRTTYASHKTVIINQIKQKPGYNLPRFYWHIHPTRSTP